jgi:hypothetical protein
MARHQSAEEVEKEYLLAFGPALGRLYHTLRNEVVWLHAKWLEYRKLYAKSEKRIDLLNGTAGSFFRIVQDVLWEDILLHIARLTDPPQQRNFENLSLLRLPDAIEDHALADELRELVMVAKAKAKFARQWRNRRLAHRDLALALGSKASPLPGASRQSVEEILASFREVMNRLHVRYLHSEVAFDHFLTHDDADALVHHLAVAVRYDERQRERFRKGSPLPEDLELPPEV